TLGLILGARPVRAALLPEWKRDGTGLPTPLVRTALRRCARPAASALAASIAAVLATLPFTWPRFGEWSAAGLVATPLSVPPMAVFLLGAWTWFFVPALVPDALLAASAKSLIALLELCDALPGSPSPLPPRPAWLLLACVAAVFVAWAARRRGGGARASGLALRIAALAGAVVLVPWAARPARTELYALDVGHGSALCLRSPTAGTWVFDAGSRDRPDVARQALGPALAAWETDAVAVVLSHLDQDHQGALPWLVERYPVRLWAGALPARIAERLPHGTPVVDPGAGVVELAAGPTRLGVARGLAVDGNEGSRALWIEENGVRALLTGDAEAEGLSALIALPGLPRELDLLLLPHHGSDSERLEPLFTRTHPARVWVSCAGRPWLGDELDRRSLDWRATGVQGVLVWRPDERAEREIGATGTSGTFPAPNAKVGARAEPIGPADSRSLLPAATQARAPPP
ncbi:MAG: ComEC/Rec2 family competence protein, partial [Planctomycetes bacterium]|nr:ComEC/Rec2 family competence protein [Planctomycetota bacterium]